MNEGKEKKSVFFIFSLLSHLLLIIFLLSLPAKVKNSEKTDYSRRVFVDFDIPAPPGFRSSSKINGKSKKVKQSISKKLIPANFSGTEEKHKIKSKEKKPLVTKTLNTKQSETPVKFSLNRENRNGIFGIQNAAFSDNGHPAILPPSGNGRGKDESGFGMGNKATGNGNGFSGRGNGKSNYYTNYYELCLQNIEEQKQYPDIAVIRQIEGAVEVKIALYPDGKVADIRIIKSSGWNMLDEEAAKCVRRASPFPSPPKGILRDSKLILSFTITFELS